MIHTPGGLLQQYSPQIGLVQRLIDAVLIASAMWVAALLVHREWHEGFSQAYLIGVLLFLLCAELTGLYRSWRTSPMAEELLRTLGCWTAVIVILLVVGFATKTSSQYSRLVIGVWFVLAPLALCSLRFVMRMGLSLVRTNGRNTRSVAVLGGGPVARQLAESIRNAPWLGLRLLGHYDRQEDDAEVQVVGTDEDLVELAHRGQVDLVLIAIPMKDESRVREAVTALADTTASVYLVPDLFLFELVHGQIAQFGDMPAIALYETPFFGADGSLKRAEDLMLGTLILAVAALPMLVISLLVKLSSPGPVLFKQRRYGLDGREVEVWKFRTMTVCEDGDDVPQARRNDARLTPLGALLRRTSLDELPQFINVLQGQMSIVGPRPHAVAHNETYRKQIRGYMLRHKVKPGITGWAQINGWRGETDTPDKMQNRVTHDLWYIQNWSLWLDIKIVFLTLIRGFTGANVY